METCLSEAVDSKSFVVLFRPTGKVLFFVGMFTFNLTKKEIYFFDNKRKIGTTLKFGKGDDR